MNLTLENLQSCMFCSGWFRPESKAWCEEMSRLLDIALVDKEKPKNLFFAYKYNKLSTPEEFVARAKELANEEVRRAFQSQVVVFNRDDINNDLGTLIEFLVATAYEYHDIYVAWLEDDGMVFSRVNSSDFRLNLESSGLAKSMLAAITAMTYQDLQFDVRHWTHILCSELPNTKTNMMIAALLDSKTVEPQNYE